MWRPVLVLCLIVCSTLNAQTTFMKTYDFTFLDDAHRGVLTSDGGAIMVGGTNLAGNGDQTDSSDVFVVRTDGEGTVLWSRTYGYSDSSSAGYDVTETQDGGFVIAGLAEGVNWWEDGLLMKIDAGGNLLWSHIYTGTYFRNDRLLGVRELVNGDLIATGYMRRQNDNSEAYLLRTDAQGQKLWSKSYGGSNSDGGRVVRPTADGGFAICGGTANFGTQGGDMWMVKTDSSGTVAWTRTAGDQLADGSSDVVGTEDDGLLWVGNTDFSILVVRTDFEGDTLWTRTYRDSSVFNSTHAFAAARVPSGGYILAGYALPGDAFLLRIDDAGDVQWARTVTAPGYQSIEAVSYLPGGDFMLFGYSYADGTGARDALLMRVDANGLSACGNSDIVISEDLTFDIQMFSPVPTVTTADLESIPQLTGTAAGTSTVQCFSVGVEEEPVVEQLILYPNPATDKVQIMFGAGSGTAVISVVDAMGRWVLTERMPTATTATLDLTGQPTGVYTVVVQQGDSRSTGRLVIGTN